MSLDSTEVARVTPESRRGGGGTGEDWNGRAGQGGNTNAECLGVHAGGSGARSRQLVRGHVWQKLDDGTRRAYTGAQYKFLPFSRIDRFLSPCEALMSGLLQVARDGKYETPVKVLLFGLRLAQKMAIIPAIVAPADWLFAGSLERLKLSKNLNICKIAKRKETWE